ncbi:alkaline phosphatase family protein [Noviherbaspirillum sp.]|uniref:alkaline phosphatase family protein n=1 Tax=Noviherbaspirillum sp. TaxID=1926288 RepID=UPI002FE165DB
MTNEKLSLGPVLSFRGTGDKGEWKVSALIGYPADAQIPVFFVDGRECAAPSVLHRSGKQQFLRYDLTCPMQEKERKVKFGFRDGPEWHFTVPALAQSPRIAYVSCNGFSNPSGMRKLVRPANAAWMDLLSNHDREMRNADYLLDKEQLWHEERIHDKNLQRFHLLVMGGDQIYFDSVWEELEPLKRWVGLSRDEQLSFKVSASLEKAIEAYYFDQYSKRWLPEKRRPWGTDKPNHDSADAMATIPTIMMWDDHDIFDGWGSYSCEMQHCPLFTVLFRHARRAFWVFQMQHALEDLAQLEEDPRPYVSKTDPIFQPIAWRERLAGDPLALPMLDGQPGFSFVLRVGAVALTVADLRTERSRTQVLGPATWAALHRWLATLTVASNEGAVRKCEHLLFLSSVPVIHPKLTLAEGLFDAFGQDHVTDSNADDLKDHWAHDDHEGERKRLLETLCKTATQCKARVSIVSGDVHVAAWGISYRKDLPAKANWAQIQQFTASAVVHPSLGGLFERIFLQFLNSAAGKPQEIDVQHEVQMMLFPSHNRHVMAARNWLALESDDRGNREALWATWRCETERGFSNHLVVVEPAHVEGG